MITLDLFHQTIVSDISNGSSDGDERWLQSSASLQLYRDTSHVTHHVTRWHVTYVTLLTMTIIRHQNRSLLCILLMTIISDMVVLVMVVQDG